MNVKAWRLLLLLLLLLLPVVGLSQVVLPPRPVGYCFKDGLPMVISKVNHDYGTNSMGGIQRSWDVILKCPKCGMKVRHVQTVWIPDGQLIPALVQATNGTNLFQSRRRVIPVPKIPAPKEIAPPAGTTNEYRGR